MKQEIKTLAINGLWHNNPALVQILGLCPLLAVSSNTINALGLGLATIFVMSLSGALVSITRHKLKPEIRIPIFVLLIASAVSLVEIIIQAFAYNLYQSLGIYLALIVTNCVIIARAESYASKNPLLPSILDGFFMGLGFALALITLGAIREILAEGTLLSHAELLFGEKAKALQITIYQSESKMILAALPAGAFFLYGFLIALKNLIKK